MPAADPLTEDAPPLEMLRDEVAAIAARSRVGGLFYLAGWALVVAASAGFSAYPLACGLIAALFAVLAGVRFLLQPSMSADRAMLLQLRRLHWGILLTGAVVWGGSLVWVMLDPAFDATRPAAVVCSILFATAFAHSYPMSLRGTLLSMGLIYLPAPLLVEDAEGGAAVQVALGVYAVYLLATALRARREYVEHLSLQRTLRRQRDRFEQLSQHDGLTGLLNHAEFASRLSRAGEQCRRSSDRASLLMLDLDHFKQVNDRLGHQAGDALLIAFAERLGRQFADLPSASVARWGGEEFAVLLPGVGLDEASRRAQALLAALRSTPLLAGRPEVRASVGIGELLPGTDPSQLLGEVDRALYRAKRDGRDRVALVAAQDGASSP